MKKQSSIARQVLAETPAETRQFVKRYAQLLVRITALLEARGWSQKDLAEKMGKKPSEISKWLNGTHNLTLRSIAKLEIELGEDLIQIPKEHKFMPHSSKKMMFESYISDETIAPGTKFKVLSYNKTGDPQKLNIA